MSVGILLLTHEGLGQALLLAATRVLGTAPSKIVTHDVTGGAAEHGGLPAASAALRKVDGEEGVLILTDLSGGAPARMAARLAQLGTPVRRVSGLSLPMLLRVFNYQDQPLDELARTAAAGARNGVVIDDA